MFSTQPIKYLFAIAMLFTSCRASRNLANTTNDEVKPAIAVAVSADNYQKNVFNGAVAQTGFGQQDSVESVVTEDATPDASTVLTTTQVKRRITSFTQMKEMARTGEIAMSKKDLKTLNRLEKHYKENYEQFRADTFEFTDKAKIIGGVGLLGLLLAIITGSAFGWFLFIVAALAFLLRYLNIIAF